MEKGLEKEFEKLGYKRWYQRGDLNNLNEWDAWNEESGDENEMFMLMKVDGNLTDYEIANKYSVLSVHETEIQQDDEGGAIRCEIDELCIECCGCVRTCEEKEQSRCV